MSPSEHVLKVVTADEIADIAVYDGNMNVVTKGVGSLEKALPAGLYRIKIRVGAETAEKLTALDRDQAVMFEPVPFSSPIPLQGTIKTHEYHMAAAADVASQTVTKTLGAGASIMVFVREWSMEGNRSSGNPAQGLSLLSSKEVLLSRIGDEAKLNDTADQDASAGWRADVEPGSYFLRLELEDANKTAILRPIYVSPRHQLQVFCLVGNHVVEEDGQRKTIRRAELATAAIVISRSDSFNPNDRMARLSELACNALTQSRGLLPQSLIDDLLTGKFDNPMLGLFGAHLLLRHRREEKALFRTVTDNLLKMLGPDHPDLQTLWWQRGDESKIGDGRLYVLPVLRASWDLAVDRSIKTLDVLSLGTFYSKLTRIVPSAPWMMLIDNDWAVSDIAIDDYLKTREDAHMSRAQARAVLKSVALRKQYAHRVYSYARGLLPDRISSYLPASLFGTESGPATSTTDSVGPVGDREREELARTLALPVQILNSILKQKGL